MRIAFGLLIMLGAGAVAGGSAQTQDQTGAAERRVEREQARFRAMDTDKDGVITQREWRGGATAFRQRDKNRDRVLSGDEIWISPEEAAVPESVKRTQAYRSGHERGLAEGIQAGKEDKTLRNQWDLEGQRELEQADSGFTTSVGRREDYQAGYRVGFRRGYREGFGPRY